MKKLFTSFLLATVACLSAFAEGDGKYYWFYDRAEVATTGKGLIYLSNASSEEEANYADISETKLYELGYSSTTIDYHAKPADGYQFVGLFQTATPASLTEALTSNSPEGSISVKTEQVTESTDVEGYGFEPDNTFYAVFSKVYVKVADALKRAGSVNIDKVINDKGDNITITATPSSDDFQFDYWLDSKGNKITENPYTFVAGDDNEVYTAYFKGDNILTIDFGEGKYIPFSSMYEADFESGIQTYIIQDKYLMFENEEGINIAFDETQNAWGYYNDDETFVQYTGEVPTFSTNYEVFSTVQAYVPNTGFVLYGEGVKTIVLFKETPEEELYPIDTYLVGTATGAVNIESLPKQDDNNNNLVYYVFDTNAFVKATSGTVAENSCYLALTEGVQYPLPEKIYIDTADDPAAITNVNTDKKIQFIGVYTINGKKVEAPVKGLNIVNGKKVFVK